MAAEAIECYLESLQKGIACRSRRVTSLWRSAPNP